MTVSIGSADVLRIGKTAVLSGTLPAGTGWQVETQEGGGPWTGTGVIVAGQGSVATVRMDGWPGEAGYRFQRVDGGATVTGSVVSDGWHLAGSVTAAGPPPVLIQASENLGTWTPQEWVFPALDGSYARVLGTLPGARGFFRAATGADGLPGDASVTQYSPPPPYQGSADYGPLYADMPQIFKDGYVTAIASTEFNRGGEIAAAAGECYELAGPFGSTTVIVSDEAPSPPAGTVDAGRGYFDLGLEPFKVLSGGPVDGILTVSSRLVPAPVTGNVKLYVVPGSNPFYMALRPFNHRAGVSKMEFLNNGSSSWVTMSRQAGNRFVYTGGPQVVYPVQVRVTSRFGEVVTIPGISSLNDGQKITGPAQFTVFPDQGPVPQRRIRPVYQNSLASVPGDTWGASGYGGATVTAADTVVKYSGTASLRINGLAGFSGVNLLNVAAFARPENGVLKLAIRSASAVTAGQVQVRISGLNAPGGSAANSAFIPLPALTTGWQVVRFPLEASGTAVVVNGLSIVNGTSATLPNVWLDEVEFETR